MQCSPRSTRPRPTAEPPPRAHRRFRPRFALAAGAAFFTGACAAGFTGFTTSSCPLGGAGDVSWRAYVPSGAGRDGAPSDDCLCGLGGCGDGDVVAGVCAGGDGSRVDVGRAAAVWASRNGGGGTLGVAWIPVSSLAYWRQTGPQHRRTLQYPS